MQKMLGAYKVQLEKQAAEHAEEAKHCRGGKRQLRARLFQL